MTNSTQQEAPTPHPENATPIALLDHDADLGADIPPEDRPLARRTLVVPSLAIDPGPLDIADLGLPDSAFAVLVISGGGLTPEQQQHLQEFGKRLLLKGNLKEGELISSIEQALKILG